MYNKQIPCNICGKDVRMDDFTIDFKGKPICTKCMLKIEQKFPKECLYFTYGARKCIVEGIIEQMKEERKNAKETEEDNSISRGGPCPC